MLNRLRPRLQHHAWLASLLALLILLVGCGGSASSGMNAAVMRPARQPMFHSTNMNAGDTSTQSQAATSSTGQQSQGTPSPQYLIKTLKATLTVKDTRKVADELQTWITTTDPRATSAGTDYEPSGDNLYTVTLTFSVQSSIYPQIYRYVRDYTSQHGGRLSSFTETVQDVSGDYVDTQSTLSNLQKEQARLQTLMSQAQSLSDVLTIEQKLSDVEGKIQTAEAHLNLLTSQVTFYTVTITLQPIDTAPPPPTDTGNGWSVGQVFHDAFAASIAFGQGLITFLVWLLAFALYLVPIAVIAWFVKRWRIRAQRFTPRPKVAPTTAPHVHEHTTPLTDETDEELHPGSGEQTGEESHPSAPAGPPSA